MGWRERILKYDVSKGSGVVTFVKCKGRVPWTIYWEQSQIQRYIKQSCSFNYCSIDLFSI